MQDPPSLATLAPELAALAQQLRARALALFRGPAAPPSPLHQLRAQTSAPDSVCDSQLVDAFAQCSTCALVTARCLSRGSEQPFTRALAAELLEARVARAGDSLSPLARALTVDALRVEDDALAKLLDRVAARLAAGVEFSADEDDALLRFYEPFLSAYDGARRRAHGVYYTPDAIVEYMLSLSDELLRHASDNEGTPGPLRVVEPAAGTGAFVLGLLRRRARAPSDSHGQTDTSLGTRPLELCAIELLLVPHVLCQLRLAARPQPPGVTLTLRRADTLAITPSLAARDRWTLVLGNPPYRNNSEQTLAQVAARYPALLASSSAAATAQSRAIRDDYAWFFAAADALTHAGGGVCLITPDSYLRKPSYRLLREALLTRFRVLRLTRLGAGVFPGVGPRIGFVVIAMLRRAAPLPDADAPPAAESILFTDLTPLAAAAREGDDPRARWLAAAARGRARDTRVETIRFAPRRADDFRLLPPRADATTSSPLQLVTRARTSRAPLFRRKWPGLITAFDRLLVAPTRDRLADRIRALFACACSGPRERDALARALELTPPQRARLELLTSQIQGAAIEYDDARLKPVLAGSIPAALAWAPPLSYARWVYYEPRLRIPRNTHARKSTGWGWMQQWRDPASHERFPKLIFTTSTNPRYGFRAFVVDARWYAKLHGGASQQFHYLHVHGNLAEAGAAALELTRSTCDHGAPEDDLLHLLAAIYNAAYGRGYAAREAESALPLPRLSVHSELARRHAPGLVADARWLRQLHAAAQLAVDGRDAHDEALPRVTIAAVEDRVGAAPRDPGARRRWLERITIAREEAQRRVDEAVAALVRDA